MRKTDSYDSEPARFMKNGFDPKPLVRGITDPSRLGKWQGYARKTNNEQLQELLRQRAQQL